MKEIIQSPAPMRADLGIALGPIEPISDPACILDILGLLGRGGFLFDDARQVLLFNDIAESCLRDGLMIRSGRLAASDPESNERLQRLMGRAGQSPRALATAVRRSIGLPLIIHALPMTAAARPVFDQAGLLLFVSAPEARTLPRPDMLSRAFGLTPAEVQVAIGIAHGRKLAEIAADRGVKTGTARTHLKTVFAKTGTRGQTELVALLARLAF
ncbi:MAG: helix-turn-helix transcriptional regulator [Rhodospirillales bacterium]|nr:helix-turn-helix transcriptional regulator [Rhodospirillales bacterium]